MMRKLVALTALATGLWSGVALADHRGRDHRAPRARAEVVVRDHRGLAFRGARRPIYVSRPVIHGRYYDQHRRPAVIVESYGPRVGYLWIGGSWGWNGGERIWQPGYYPPSDLY